MNVVIDLFTAIIATSTVTFTIATRAIALTFIFSNFFVHKAT